MEKEAVEKAEREAKEKIARQRLPTPEIKKPEKQIVSAPVIEELKREPKKEIPAKPFTKLLDPSSLSLQGTSYSQGDASLAKPNLNARVYLSQNLEHLSPLSHFFCLLGP